MSELIESCAYKPSVDCSQEELAAQEWELALVGLDFWRFLRWVRIVEPPKPGLTGGGVVPLILWKHIIEIVEVLLGKNLISIAKARQIGLSTILAAYVLWYALFHIGANILLFSKAQPEAKELLSKSRRIYDQLPSFMKEKLDPNSTEELGFPSVKSLIKAFPSTPSAGISYTASIVVCDEHAEHEYADENYLSSKPTRDAGGQFISVFTENAWTNDNLATAIFTDALSDKNDFVTLFFPYDVVPGRDDDWYAHTKRNIPDRELGRLSPDLYMAKNYPRSIEEMLSLADSVVVFDKRALNVMREDCHGQINLDFEDVDNSIVNIYKDFHIGNFYISATDIAQGVKGDYSVTVIMDVKTGDIVADIMSNTLKPEELALHSVSLLKRYHNPLWWIEFNIWGKTLYEKAVELGYKRFGFRDKNRLKPGFQTGEQNRYDLFGRLIPAINDQQIRIYNLEGLNQFYGVIRNQSKGKIEASSGGHDDYVMAVGLAWLKKDDVQTGTTFKPIETLTFNQPDIPPVIRKLIDRRQYA